MDSPVPKLLKRTVRYPANEGSVGKQVNAAEIVVNQTLSKAGDARVSKGDFGLRFICFDIQANHSTSMEYMVVLYGKD